MEFKDKIKDFIILYRSKIVIGFILLLLIIGGNIAIYFLIVNNIKENQVYEIDNSVSLFEEKNVENEEKKLYYKVDIKGAIKKSGVYELKSDARVIDVINLAGGLNENADTSVINLSKYIKDEMVIVIYTKDEVLNFKKVIEEEKEEEKQCIIYNEIIENNGCKDNVTNNDIELDKDNDSNDNNVSVDVKVSINTADVELLMTIPGIGESKAKSIIEYRENEGLYISIEDIMKVSGIGEKLFESIKEYITV